jgi:type II secretory ATPase GspE/PulE/Tfp pilus assembly ATPase PilB-like protein
METVMSSKEMDSTQTIEIPSAVLIGHNGHAAWEPPAAFRWPAPPFYQPLPDAADATGECLVEFADGSDQSFELVSIDERGQTAQVRAADTGLVAIALGEVRSITLKHGLKYLADGEAIRLVGGSQVDVSQSRPFVVYFKGGAKLEGRTRGFLRSHGGLFFFLAQHDQPTAVPCYVPMAPVDTFQVGAMVGRTMEIHSQPEAGELGEALACHARERDQRLGAYMAHRAIASRKDLKDALGSQERRPKQRIGAILVDAGLITQGELDRALALQAGGRGRRRGEVLVSMGVVSTRTVQVMLSEKLGIPYVNAEAFEVDPAAIELVPAELAQRYNLLPLLRLGKSLVVAVENPLAIEFEQSLGFTTHCTIVPVIADPAQIAGRIATEYFVPQTAADPRPQDAAAPAATGEDIEQLARRLEQEAPAAGTAMTKKPAHEPSINSNTLVRLVNRIITDAHARGASDIHIETGHGQRVRVRFRRDGELVDYLQLGHAYAAAMVSRLKIMAGLDIAERRLAQDGKIQFGRFAPLAIELRVAVVPTSDNSEDIVLRILGGVAARPLDKIGLAPRNVAELERMTGRNHGLILVCGPTGSGKTTTLHSVLRHLNRADLKIWTAEDPVEIVQPGLRQVQVNAQTGWTFAQAMRSFLRADPDVIMVGEMRDAETARTAIEASLTGHLVLSTLHTNSAAETVTRLLDLGMDPFNFSDSLLGVLSQRLARRLCPACRRPRELHDAEAHELAVEYCQGTSLDPATVLREWRTTHGRHGRLYVNAAVGCEECDAGYRGRVGIHELLSVTPEMRRMIRTRGPADELAVAAQAGGMRLLKQDALEKVLTGEIDLASARTAAN